MRDAVPLVIDLLVDLYGPSGIGCAHSVQTIPFQLVGSGIDFLVARSTKGHGVQHGLVPRAGVLGEGIFRDYIGFRV